MASPLRDLGPGRLEFNGTDCGPARGGIKVFVEESLVDILEDQHGVAPVDKINVGTLVRVEALFTRATLTQMGIWDESATVTGTKLEHDNKVGGGKFSGAKELILKPRVNQTTSTTNTEWWYFHKASPQVNWEVPYDNENQRLFMVTFHCFPDDTSGRVGEIFRIGPSS